MGAGQSSSSRRRPGDEEIDRVLELIRTDPGDPGIDTSCQCPITTFTTSKYTSSSTYFRCPSRWCFCNAPSKCALTKYPSACHLAFYKLLENMQNLWGRSVLAKWVLHEPSLHCNQAFNKSHFNALQFMF